MDGESLKSPNLLDETQGSDVNQRQAPCRNRHIARGSNLQPAGVAERTASTQGIPPEELLDSPHALIGSVDEICDDLEARRDRWGISYWVVPAHVRTEFAPVVERLAGR